MGYGIPVSIGKASARDQSERCCVAVDIDSVARTIYSEVNIDAGAIGGVRRAAGGATKTIGPDKSYDSHRMCRPVRIGVKPSLISGLRPVARCGLAVRILDAATEMRLRPR